MKAPPINTINVAATSKMIAGGEKKNYDIKFLSQVGVPYLF
jgi:hypothetical protein